MRRLGRLALVAALAGALHAGCGPGADLRGVRSEVRTGRITLNRAMQRAFIRQYAAAHRMRTGRANEDIVSYANVRCRARGRQPAADAEPWPWRCRVRWRLQGGRRLGAAFYDVGVGTRGCFVARSADFPATLVELALERPAANPLARFRSCP